MVERNANRSEAQKLAEVALRLQPATFYYTIERGGERIGAASSALDTATKALQSEEYFVGDFPTVGADGQNHTIARWQTRLTRGLHLIDMVAAVARAKSPWSLNATIQDDSTVFIAGNKETRHPPAHYSFVPPLFNPTLASIVFMLGRRAQGRQKPDSIRVRSNHAHGDAADASHRRGVSLHRRRQRGAGEGWRMVRRA